MTDFRFRPFARAVDKYNIVGRPISDALKHPLDTFGPRIDEYSTLRVTCLAGRSRFIDPVSTSGRKSTTRRKTIEFNLATVYLLPRRRNQRATAQYLDIAAAGRAGPGHSQVAGTQSLCDGLGTQTFS